MKKEKFKKYLALVIVGCALINILFTGCNKKDGSAADTITVENAQDAVAKLGEKAEEFGYENALSELTEKSSSEIDGDSYYRLQQNYKGIPVYGRTVICATDEEGTISSLTGNVADITNEVDLTPTIDASQVTALICTFFADEYGYEVGEMKIDPLSENDLCIFIETDSAEAHLAYCICWGAYEIVIDAHDGQILSVYMTLYEDNTEVIEGCTESDRSKTFPVEMYDESSYIMYDSDRKLRVYTLNYKSSGDGTTINHSRASLIQSDDTVFGNSKEEKELEYEKGAALYQKAIFIHDYFDKLSFNPIVDGVYLYYNDKYDDGENALGGVLTIDGKQTGVVSMGIYKNSVDTVGHEYTHYISRNVVNWKGDDETKALNEAMSDLFGELLESAYNSAGKQTKIEPDWNHGSRNMIDPGKNGYPTKTTDPNNSREDFAHGYSTVITHAAYLMWNGGIDGDTEKKINTDDLAKLWYRAMLMMPSDCDFVTCRKMVEWAAVSVASLTDAQRECISEAFDRVGIKNEELSEEILIDCDKNITPGSNLAVYNADRELHPSYTLNISGTIAEHKQAYSSNVLIDIGYGRYEETREIKVAAEEPLELQDGYYTFTITDKNNPQFEYVFTVSVSDKGTDNKIELYTDFEDRLVVKIEPEPEEEVTIVTDAYWDTVTDSRFDMQCCYHIPKFNLPGGVSTKINDKIYNDMYNILQKDVYDVYDEYGYVNTGKMNYAWGQKGNIASVIVETNWLDVNFTEYHIYNVNTETGEEASRAEVLAAFGLNEESFKAQAKEMLKSKFETVNSWAIESVGKSEYNKKLNSTISDDNIKEAKLYINEKGQLCVMIPFYGFAGPERTNSCLSLETGDWQYVPECEGHTEQCGGGVTDAYSDALVNSEYGIDYCYHIPQFDLPNGIADKINGQIYDEMYNLLQGEVYSVYNEYSTANMNEMVYVWGEENGLISVLIKTDSPYATDPQYYTYTVKADSGGTASKSEMIAAFGMSETEFKTKMKESASRCFDDLNARQKEYVGEAAYNNQLNKTVSESNLEKAKLYINRDGELCAVLGVYMFAGGEHSYNYCISLEKAGFQQDPKCEVHK